MISNQLIVRTVVGFACVIASAVSTSAPAEDAGAEQGRSGVVEEIIVTARKRQESFVDVPTSLTVLGAAQLNAYDTRELSDLAHSTPNLYVDQHNALKRIAIRGFGNASINTFFDQAVGLAVDGLNFQRVETYELGYFDVERIEVLRGPQGSYFGKNTTAGLINITSRGPTEQFESSVTAGYESETGEQLYKFDLSGPISDRWAGRLALQHRTAEGWIESTRSADWDSDQAGPDETMGRSTLLWTPSDEVTITSKTSFTDFTMKGSPVQLIECGPSLQGYMGAAVALGFIQNVDDCAADDRRSGSAGVPGGINGGGPDRREVQGWSQALTIDWRLGEYTLTSVTGYQDFESDAMLPASWFEAKTTSARTISEWDDFSQEFRLLSPSFDWGSFVVGAFYNSSQIDSSQGVDFNFPVLSLGQLPFASSALKPLDLEQQSFATFGEITWLVAEDWSLTVGGRYTRDEKDTELSQTLGPLGVADDPAHPAVSTPFIGLAALTGWTAFNIQGSAGSLDRSPNQRLGRPA